MNPFQRPGRTSHSHRTVCLTLALIMCLLLPFSAAAQEPDAPRFPTRETPPQQPLQPAALLPSSGMTKVVIELEAQPAALTYADAQPLGLNQAGDMALQQLLQIEQAQQNLLAPLAQTGASVIYRTQRVYNGIGVEVDAANLDAIAALPGVKAIHPLVTKYPHHSTSVPLIGAPKLWGNQINATGRNIKIGIIDTGIDYIHTNFGGSGLAADYKRNNGRLIGEAGLFPNSRVMGGYDFVGDAYNGENQPRPDPDPMDCSAEVSFGHGTHVAGSAAGSGVNPDGSTFTGPYTPDTDFTEFRIAPGVAPEAKLYALRVFGCSGGSDMVDLAIEWAMDPNGDGRFNDRLDIINMSLGSDYGSTYDSTAIASENAAKAGLIVVASAGNAGDSYYIHGSPASADSVISVASSVDAGSMLDGFAVTAPDAIADIYHTWFSDFYPWESSVDVAGGVVYPPSQRDGCEPFDAANSALLAGKIALLDWTDDGCGSVQIGEHVVQAGGIGAIVVDDSAVFDLYIGGSEVIPMISIARETGDLLKANLAGLEVTLSGTLAQSVAVSDPSIVDMLSSFSSRGPQIGGALKPDVAAPGDTIFSARSGSGNLGMTMSGTSMAAPHVAGAMALLKQLRPTWSPAELKALLMNTAVQDLRSLPAANSAVYGPARAGAGRVNLPNAATQQVIAFDAAQPSRVSVSFGNPEVASTSTAVKQVRVVNKGTTRATFNLGYTPVTVVPGVTYTIAPATVTLNAGAAANVSVTMTANAAAMKHTRDATVSDTHWDEPRHWLSEASGYLTLTPPAATMMFKADIRGIYETQPVNSPVIGTGVFTYTAASRKLDYAVTFNRVITLNSTGARIHRGAAGVDGAVAYTLSGAGAITTRSGSVTLSAADTALLLNGGMYVNFHTAANPTGEVRGQIVTAQPVLRLPIYAAPRPAAAMRAARPFLQLSNPAGTNVTTTIPLTGSGVRTGTRYPLDELSVVTALELQATSPALAARNPLVRSADLRYIGVMSDVYTAGSIGRSTITFGMATHGNWSSLNRLEFDVLIDTNRDGTDDFVLFTTSTGGWYEPTDVPVVYMCTVDRAGECTDFTQVGYVNLVSAAALNTVPFNTNVLSLSVPASRLKLTAGSGAFHYRVLSFENWSLVDASETLTYNPSRPGIAVSGGVGSAFKAPAGMPLFRNLPGQSIPVRFDAAAYRNNNSQGVLLLHHHNATGQRAEVVRGPSTVQLPLVRR